MTDEPLSENDLIEESGALIYSIAAAPGLQVGQPGIAFAGHSAGLLRSQDGGATWQDALEALSLSDTLPVTALALTPNFEQDGRVFAGAPGGIFLSSDSGQSWKAVLFPRLLLRYLRWLSPPIMPAIKPYSPGRWKTGSSFLRMAASAGLPGTLACSI